MLFRVRVEENNISENPPFGAFLGVKIPPFVPKQILLFSKQTLSVMISTGGGADRSKIWLFFKLFFCSVGVQFQTVLMVMNREHKKSPCFIQFRIRRAKKFLGEKVKRLVYYVVVDKKE